MSRKSTTERVVYSVSIDLPAGVSCTQMKKYLYAAWADYPTFTKQDANIPSIELNIKLLERHVKYTR